MRPTRFAFLLDLHGPDPARWPRRERAAAESLLAESAEAQRLLAEAHRLDAALRHCVLAVEDEAVHRVLSTLPDALRQPRSPLKMALWSWGLLPLQPRLGLVAASLILGLIVGLAVDERPTAHQTSGSTITFLVIGTDPEGEWLL